MSNRDPWFVRYALGWLGQDCVLCGTRIGQQILCGACTASLPAAPRHCPKCALPTPGGTVCGSCLAEPPHFDGTSALWLYEFPCDQLIQALKYRARLEIASFFAHHLASVPMPKLDLIVPMPLHPRRLAQRGFNQALEISRDLAKRTGLPLEPRAARRVRNTAAQTGLPYEERARNVRGAFVGGLDLSGKTVAVVDDVMTTGATLDELARTLKRSGAAEVHNLVVARSVLR